MRYARLNNKYEKFFKSGESYFPIEITDFKGDFVKHLDITLRNYLIYYFLFSGYMNNDIRIIRNECKTI